jgi:hypothetical protein
MLRCASYNNIFIPKIYAGFFLLCGLLFFFPIFFLRVNLLLGRSRFVCGRGCALLNFAKPVEDKCDVNMLKFRYCI